MTRNKLVLGLGLLSLALNLIAQPYSGGGNGPYPVTFNNVLTIPSGGTNLGQLVSNATYGTSVILGPGYFTVSNAFNVPPGVKLVGAGPNTVISNYAALSSGPCIIPGDNCVIQDLAVVQSAFANAGFSAAIGSAGQSGNQTFTNVVIINVTATNGNTDGWYVRQTNCSATLYNCVFKSKWDSGAVFGKGCLFRYYNCAFKTVGPTTAANTYLAHGFYATGNTNIFYSCDISAQDPPASAPAGFETNTYALSIERKEDVIPVAECFSCTFSSSAANYSVYDVGNGFYAGAPGLLSVTGCKYDTTKVQGPINEYSPAEWSTYVETNSAVIVVSNAGNASVNGTYWLKTVGPPKVWTNSSGFASGICNADPGALGYVYSLTNATAGGQVMYGTGAIGPAIGGAWTTEAAGTGPAPVASWQMTNQVSGKANIELSWFLSSTSITPAANQVLWCGPKLNASTAEMGTLANMVDFVTESGTVDSISLLAFATSAQINGGYSSLALTNVTRGGAISTPLLFTFSNTTATAYSTNINWPVNKGDQVSGYWVNGNYGTAPVGAKIYVKTHIK